MYPMKDTLPNIEAELKRKGFEPIKSGKKVIWTKGHYYADIQKSFSADKYLMNIRFNG